MTIDDFYSNIENTALEFPFISSIREIDRTDNALKVRLIIKENFFIQVYANIRTKTTAYSLILGNERLYGRDSELGRWHRHPIANPDKHDVSKEGKRKFTLKEFLLEVRQIIEDRKIL